MPEALPVRRIAHIQLRDHFLRIISRRGLVNLGGHPKAAVRGHLVQSRKRFSALRCVIFCKSPGLTDRLSRNFRPTVLELNG